ncbi:MAG: bifunctional riboflavin kinase/FAD synthetase [Lachnospiraceae bacterium]
MRVIQGTTQFKLEQGQRSVVAIGKFDGMHKGHQRLLQELFKYRDLGLQTVILTFDASFSTFLGNKPQRDLTTKEEKRQIFEAMGIDVLVEFPINETTIAMKPELFVSEILTKQLQAKQIVAGTDLSFGDQGAGNIALLNRMAVQGDYGVSIIEKVCYERTEISSTYVRDEVEKRKMQLVTKLLGYPYSISGVVQQGRRIGRTLEMPTVNLQPTENKLLPPNGVYFSYLIYQGNYYKGLTNIGCKPTVTQEKTVLVETYIYNFEKDIYGEPVTVQLLTFRRPEVRFADLAALKAQIQKDKEAGELYFAVQG